MLLLLVFAARGASMHSRSAASRWAQPPADCELEPQQSVSCEREEINIVCGNRGRSREGGGTGRTQHGGHGAKAGVCFGFVGVPDSQAGDGL